MWISVRHVRLTKCSVRWTGSVVRCQWQRRQKSRARKAFDFPTSPVFMSSAEWDRWGGGWRPNRGSRRFFSSWEVSAGSSFHNFIAPHFKWEHGLFVFLRSPAAHFSLFLHPVTIMGMIELMRGSVWSQGPGEGFKTFLLQMRLKHPKRSGEVCKAITLNEWRKGLASVLDHLHDFLRQGGAVCSFLSLFDCLSVCSLATAILALHSAKKHFFWTNWHGEVLLVSLPSEPWNSLS